MDDDHEELTEYLYKVLVVGDIGTGKTSIIKRYVHNIFSTNYKSTIGVDFALKIINWDDHSVIRLQLWDIAGQERFGNMTRVYYKEAVGAFVVFDVSKPSTFEAVAKWKHDIDSKLVVNDKPIPVVLLANKCDLPSEGPVKDSNAMNEYCKEHGFAHWIETSARDNINIDEAARDLVRRIFESDSSRRRANNDTGAGNSGRRANVSLEQNAAKDGGGCAC